LPPTSCPLAGGGHRHGAGLRPLAGHGHLQRTFPSPHRHSASRRTRCDLQRWTCY
jgi:hypothetical protein